MNAPETYYRIYFWWPVIEEWQALSPWERITDEAKAGAELKRLRGDGRLARLVKVTEEVVDG